jgi:hypothetical protein
MSKKIEKNFDKILILGFPYDKFMFSIEISRYKF